jgi:hypothetical protein
VAAREFALDALFGCGIEGDLHGGSIPRDWLEVAAMNPHLKSEMCPPQRASSLAGDPDSCDEAASMRYSQNDFVGQFLQLGQPEVGLLY